MLINWLRGVKRKAPEVREPDPIQEYVEIAIAAQRSDSTVQPINRQFPKRAEPIEDRHRMKKNLPGRYAYPACFMPYRNDGDYWVVHFPDLVGCMTNAETLEEAIEQAHNILEDYMALLERDGCAIPQPTPYENVKSKKNEIVQIVVASMASARRRWEEGIIEKTLTLPRWLDEMGQGAGLNYSQVLKEALEERLIN